MKAKHAHVGWDRLNRLAPLRAAELVVSKPNCKVVAADSRELLQKFPSDCVDCIITSPPYGALKDYGSATQIGFGQSAREYFPDLEGVFGELYRVARDGAALWIILDTWKSKGDTVPLPWEISARVRKTGWSFQDFIVWDKGRSLPWSHHGRFRGVCEYILLFGKGRLKTFDLKAVRETANLAPYWIKYPERYNPDGKAPTDLWHFQIPTQGSWATSSRRHFCPFPVELAERMIEITSRKGDLVLDPFAGTGTVVAVAGSLGRYGLGIEINRQFVAEFSEAGYQELQKQVRAIEGGAFQNSSNLRRTIVRLRVLKYPKTLFAELLRKDRLGERALESICGYVVSRVVFNSAKAATAKGKFATITLEILLSSKSDKRTVAKAVEAVSKIPPLSKFGLEVDLRVVSSDVWGKWSENRRLTGTWYLYSKGAFNKFSRKGSFVRIIEEVSRIGRRVKYPPIVSAVGIFLTVSD